MELSEAIVRVIGRHLGLIALLVGCGVLGAGLLHRDDVASYQATARLTLDAEDPSTQAESLAIADTVTALSTSPSLVRAALDEVGVRRDPVAFAAQNIGVAGLGTSGVVSITVTDTDAGAAIALANRIAQDVIAAHNRGTSSRRDAAVASLQKQISDTQRAIASIDAHLSSVGPLYEPKGPDAVPLNDRPWTPPNRLLRQRSDLQTTLSALQSARATLESDGALLAAGEVVDPAAAPALAVPSRLVADLALGGLLGLLVGLALAAADEALRPTLIGRDAIARAVGAPVLAELRATPVGMAQADVAEAAMHIELAAVAAQARRVGLLALSRQLPLRTLAELLDSCLPHLSVQVIGPKGARDDAESAGAGPDPRQEQTWLRLGGDAATGVVLVTPRSVRLSQLNRMVEFLTISGWALLGVVVIRARGPVAGLHRAQGTARGGTRNATVDTSSR